MIDGCADQPAGVSRGRRGGKFLEGLRAPRHLHRDDEQHVANLERQLGVRLLNRTTRHLSLTEAGSVYFEQCSEALDILSAAESAVGVQTAHPQGVLKVTAP